MQPQITPEQRMLKNERKRIQGFINDYERNPKKWNKGMVETLERLALQYQIPFKRATPTAGMGAHIAAGLGGLADSVVFDLIPDKWYSDESTRTTANAAKITGYVGQVAAAIAATALTGGAAAPTIGLAAGNVAKAAGAIGGGIKAASGIGKVGAAFSGAGKTALEAAKLGGTALSKVALPYQATRMGLGSLRTGLTPYGAQQGWKWAKAAQTAATGEAQKAVVKNASAVIKQGGDLAAVVKGANLSKANITKLTNQISKKYGNKKAGQEMMRQLKTGAAGTEPIAGLSSSQFGKIVDKISLVGNPNVTKKAIQAVASAAKFKITPKQAEAIVSNLLKNNVTKMRDAIPHLMSMSGSPAAQAAELTARSIGNVNTLMGAGGLGFVAAKGGDLRTPSREELEASQDPYDPYNV